MSRSEMSSTVPASGLASQATTAPCADERVARLRGAWLRRELRVDGASLADAILARASTTDGKALGLPR